MVLLAIAALAIAANDKLAEKYQDTLFAEGNLSLLPLLIGGQKYIEAFIEKFHGIDGVYDKVKDQTLQLGELNKIGFFSVIALRKEQGLLNAVFVEYVLRDFGQVLKTSKPDPLYGVLETASLIKNEEFITIVLGAFERYINEPTKKASTEELLKKSFATLLETAISQEHISVIEYLCKRYTNSADHAIYDVYEQAFADDKVITILRQQILKNIGARGRKEIYDLILKTALSAGNIAFIEHLCEKCAECSNDVINYLDQKFKNNEFDNIHESILIALSNVEGASTVINEPSVLSQVVNEKSDDQSENPGLESAGSQQPQKIVDNRENTMNSEKASEEERINDCEEGEVPKKNSSNNQRSNRASVQNSKSNNAISNLSHQSTEKSPSTLEMALKEVSQELRTQLKSGLSNYQVESILKIAVSKCKGEISKLSSKEKNQICRVLDTIPQGKELFYNILQENLKDVRVQTTKLLKDNFQKEPSIKVMKFILEEAVNLVERPQLRKLNSKLEQIKAHLKKSLLGVELFCAVLQGKPKDVQEHIEQLHNSCNINEKHSILNKAKRLADEELKEGEIKKQITKCLEDALTKLSAVNNKPKTPEVPSVTDRQFTDSSNGSAAAPPGAQSLHSQNVPAPEETGNNGANKSDQLDSPQSFVSDDKQPGLPSLSPQSPVSDNGYSSSPSSSTKLPESNENVTSNGDDSSSSSRNGSATVETSNAPLGVNNESKTEDVTNSKDMPVINGASSKDDCEFESDQSDNEYSSISSGASYASTIKAREGLEDDNNLSTDEHKQPSPPLSSQSPVKVINEESHETTEPVTMAITPEIPSVTQAVEINDEQLNDTGSNSGVSPFVQPISQEQHISETDDVQNVHSQNVLAPEGNNGANESDQLDSPQSFVSDDKQPGLPSLSPQSPVSDNGYSSSPSSSTKLPESNENVTSNGDDSSSSSRNGSATVETSNAPLGVNNESKTEDVTDSKGMSVINGASSENGLEDEHSDTSVATVIELNGNENGRQSDNQNNAALPVQPATHETPNAFVNSKSITKEPVVATTNSDSDDERNTEDNEQEPLLNDKDNSKQSSDPDKNNTAPQNTKSSKWPVIAASTIAIAGVAAGIAIAVYLEMLAVGIAVGACCLATAAIIYYCKPASSLENSNTQKNVDNEKFVGP